jgi:hypothetical protein
MNSCKLNDAPPIGEMNHNLGNCYCHLCTCGEHKCPGDNSRVKKYLPSVLASNYRKDYTKKPPVRSEYPLHRPFKREPARSPDVKMDLRTTTQQDFVPHKIEKTSSAKYIPEDHTNVLKFSGNSNYKRDFPNWGYYEFIHIGRARPPYEANKVKLSPKTMYSENFCKGLKGQRAQSQKKIQSPNPLTAATDFFGVTTTKDTFRTYRKDNFPERAVNKAYGILQLESPKGLYATMYKSEYSEKASSPMLTKRGFRF